MSTANFLGAVGLFTVTGAACSQSLARTSPLQALIRTRVTAIIKSLTMTRTLPTSLKKAPTTYDPPSSASNQPSTRMT